MRALCSLLLGLPLFLYADAQPYFQGPSNQPWLTGSLLSPSENVVPEGSWNVEPYLLFNTQYGQYDSHWHSHSVKNNLYSVLSVSYMQYGFAPRVDVQIAPQFSWNHTHGASAWTVGDVSVIFDIQLLYMQEDRWWPNVKLMVGGSIPLGKYQHLKQGIDRSGSGSLSPSVGLVAGRVFALSGVHFLRARAFASYTVSNGVSVRGLNAYGGGQGTCGRVYPGQDWTGILSGEYTLSTHWALALDVQYEHINKQRFKGRTRASMHAPSSESLSLAPALEYNWSENVGLISGVWFSAAGRNSAAFANWTSALNLNF